MNQNPDDKLNKQPQACLPPACRSGRDRQASKILHMPDSKRAAAVKDIFSGIAPYIDPFDTAFSLGLCHLWRRKLVSEIRRGENILDLCTGTGEVARLLLKKIGPEGLLTCLDFCEDMLEIAKKKLSPLPGNLSFVVADAREMSFPDNAFDAVTVAFGMRNVPDTAAALKEINRVLKPKGRFYCLELTRPQQPCFLPIYKFYVFKIMPSVAKIITRNSLPYTYLPQSIEAFYPPAQFTQIMTECGFSGVRSHSMSLGIATLYSAEKG